MTYQSMALRHPGMGSKRVCVSCAAHFYDMEKTPPVCPKCATIQPPEAPRAPPIRRSLTRHRLVKGLSTAPIEAEEDAAPVLETDDDELEADADEEDTVEVDAEADVEAELDDLPDA
jgi:uncharacterized protein (TIGR02300 family)